MNDTNQSPTARRRDFLKTVALATGATEVEAQALSPDTKAGTETNGEGFFTSPPLTAGNYQVSVEHTGFKTALRTGISLQVDQLSNLREQNVRSFNPKQS